MTNLEYIENFTKNILKECPEKVDTEAYCHISSGDYDYGDGTLIVGEVSKNGDIFEFWLIDDYEEIDMNKDFKGYLERHNLTINDFLKMKEVWDKMSVDNKRVIMF